MRLIYHPAAEAEVVEWEFEVERVDPNAFSAHTF
jgi:hypothetical protein